MGLIKKGKTNMSAVQDPREMFTSADRSAQIAAGAKLTDGRDTLLISMHPEELRETMEALGCTTQSALAAAIGVDRSTISLWLDGRVGVPRPVSKLLRLMRAL